MTSTYPELGWPHHSPREMQVLSLQAEEVARRWPGGLSGGLGEVGGIGDPPLSPPGFSGPTPTCYQGVLSTHLN